MNKILVAILALSFTVNVYALEKLRVGVLSFGTVNWELNVLKHHKLDKKNNFELEVVKLASKNAVAIALQGKSVDVIVTDWIWVSRERAKGSNFTLYPYSRSVGALYVRPELNIKSLSDLKGRKIGIAGGPVDKTWLLMRAYTKAKYKKDFKKMVNPVFASPPILNKQILKKKLAGVTNFWHFNAKLKANGMERLLGVEEIFSFFNIRNDIPLLGWAFREQTAKKSKMIDGFLQASYESKKILNSSDKEWDRIRPFMRAKKDVVFESLKDGYKNGIVKSFGKNEINAATKVFEILAKEGGAKLVGKSKTLQKGTFYDFKPSVKW